MDDLKPETKIYAGRIVNKKKPKQFTYGVLADFMGQTYILKRTGKSYAIACKWAKKYKESLIHALITGKV